MKIQLKHYHIFIFALVVFIFVYVSINNKYDRFYRIAGIDNESRILIETYLDEDSQNYIIENNLSVSDFIRYITYPNFNIEYYEYYAMVEASNTYASIEEMITQTNIIVDKLIAYSSWSVSDNLNSLIEAKLLPDYANNDNFNFRHIAIYQELKSNYEEGDYSYLSLVDGYIEDLQTLGYKTLDECSEVLTNLFEYYTTTEVDTLISASMTAGKVVFIEDPTAYTTILNSNEDYTISSYTPSDLTLIEDIPRYRFFLYLREEAYTQLKALCSAYEQEEDHDPYFVLSAYSSYDSVSEDSEVEAGKQEEQLGMTVSFQVSYLSVDDFYTSSFFEWLSEHAYEYGYILRYPEGKEDATGREYSANTYRYVGVEIATAMHEYGYTTLEEYLAGEEYQANQ